MKEALADMIKYTHGLGISINQLIIENVNGETKLEAVQDKGYVLVRATFKTAIPELVGRNGFADLETLKAILSNGTVLNASTKVDIELRTKDGRQFVEKMTFTDADGQVDRYGLMNSDLIKSKNPYKGSVHEVVINPIDPSKLAELQYLSATYGKFDSFFRPKVVNEEFRIYVTDEGSASSGGHRTLAKGIKEDITKTQVYSANEMLSVMKVAAGNNGLMMMNFKGAIIFEFESEHLTWQFALPGQHI